MEKSELCVQYRQWILEHHIEDATYKETDNEIMIESSNGYAKVIFNHQEIIELMVYNNHTRELEFYLHFQINTLDHAKQLFKETLDALNHLINQPTYRILLCCSGGLTTSYFVEKINGYIGELYKEYSVGATSYMNLYNEGEKYDLIMLAPQISYILPTVKEVFKDKKVIKIPPQVFAKYDVGKMLMIINKEIESLNKIGFSLKSDTKLSINKEIPKHGKILVLSIIRNSQRVHIMHRIYNQNNDVILNQEIIKYKLSLEDIFDVIDTVLVSHQDIESIGLSMPGIINKEKVGTPNIDGMEEINIYGALESKYAKYKISLENDVNTAAVGYYASMKDKCDLTCLFQTVNYYSGAGTIIDGKLVCGKHHLAGEMQFLPISFSEDIQVLNKTPEGTLEVVSKIITSITAVIEPEKIVIFSTLLTKPDELKQKVSELIPNQPLPEIIIEKEINLYTIIGQLIISAQNS